MSEIIKAYENADKKAKKFTENSNFEIIVTENDYKFDIIENPPRFSRRELISKGKEISKEWLLLDNTVTGDD